MQDLLDGLYKHRYADDSHSPIVQIPISLTYEPQVKLCKPDIIFMISVVVDSETSDNDKRIHRSQKIKSKCTLTYTDLKNRI